MAVPRTPSPPPSNGSQSTELQVNPISSSPVRTSTALRTDVLGGLSLGEVHRLARERLAGINCLEFLTLDQVQRLARESLAGAKVDYA